MSRSTVIYVDEAGVHNAIIDNSWGGDTHITAETREALDLAVAREERFLDSLVNGPSSIAERILELDCD